MIYVHPEVRCEEYAADEAGNPHMAEHNEIASGNKNAHAGMASSLPPPSPS